MALELAIIVINYRTPVVTLECLETLAPEVEPGIRVLVVDNASGDGSAERIEAAIAERGWQGWAEVLRSPVNGGFAAGNNLGLRAVDAPAYLLLNSDTLVRRGALRSLLEAMRLHPRAGIIGAGLLNAAGEPDSSFFRLPVPASELVRAANWGPVTRLLRRFDLVMDPTEEPLEPDWLGFACVLVRREVIDAVGLLDDGYFMYFEDVDYCRRVRAAGFGLLYWPAAKVVHLQGGSSQVSAAGKLKRRAPRYYYEARARYFAKFHGRAGLWLANLFWCAGRLVSFGKQLLGRPVPHREREALDIWINASNPLRQREGATR